MRVSLLNNVIFRAYFQALLITDVHARFHKMFGKGDIMIELSFSSTNYWGLFWCYSILSFLGRRVYVSKPKYGKWGATIVLSTYLSKDYADIVSEVYREGERAGVNGKLRGKRIPSWLYRCRDMDVHYAFIAGLIDGDGTINMLFSKKSAKTQFFIYTHDNKLATSIVKYLRGINIRAVYYDSVRAVSIIDKETVCKIVREISKYVRHPLKQAKLVRYIEYLNGSIDLETLKATYERLKSVVRRSSLEWYTNIRKGRCPATPT